jgi:hypothetical protein
MVSFHGACLNWKQEAFPDGRATAGADEDENEEGPVIDDSCERPAVIAPAPGELKLEADKLRVEFQSERDREAQLGEVTLMFPYAFGFPVVPAVIPARVGADACDAVAT